MLTPLSVEVVEEEEDDGVSDLGVLDGERVDGANEHLAVLLGKGVGVAGAAHHLALEEGHHVADVALGDESGDQVQQRAADLGGGRAEERHELHHTVLQQTAVMSNDHRQSVENDDLDVVVRLRGEEAQQRVGGRLYRRGRRAQRDERRRGLEGDRGGVRVQHALERLDETALEWRRGGRGTFWEDSSVQTLRMSSSATSWKQSP